jgi:predicted helicase
MLKVVSLKKQYLSYFHQRLKTQRDEWVYDFDQDNLIKKIQFLISIYQQTLKI